MKKNKEKNFKKYDLQFNSLFENNHIIMLLINPENGYIIDANSKACKFYGYTKEKILSMKITDINLLSKSAVFNEMESANTLKHNYFQFKHRLSNGEIRDVEVYSGPVKIEDNNLLYSIIIDITEKIKAQEQIKESEESYRRLVELSPDGIMVYQDYIIVFANKKMAEIMECLSPNELIGKNVLQIIHPDYVDTSIERIKGITQGIDAPLIVSKLINTKGKEIDIEVTSNSLLYEGKTSIQSLIRDITERKKIDEQLKGYTEQLERGLEIAHEIQAKHLPTKNQIEGVDIEVLYKPLMELGGDYCKIINDSYNIIDHNFKGQYANEECKLESENYGILMGDVAGKGPSAAMITNEILSFLKYYNLKKQRVYPTEILRSINEHLYNIGTKNIQLATASYYDINILLGKMKYSNAGHEKGILYRKKDKSVVWLDTEGILLGISVPELIEYEEKNIDIYKGDKLILFSDGITELRDENGTFFGEDTLYNLVKKYGEMCANDLKKIIEKEISLYTKNSQYHDDCILVILDFMELGKKTYEIPAGFKHIGILYKAIFKSISNLGFEKEDIFDIKLALNEALTNAIIHGSNNDTSKKISIVLELTQDDFRVTVKDQGKGFDYKRRDSTEKSILEEQGRGLIIIDNIMDNVIFSDRGTAITMIKKYN